MTAGDVIRAAGGVLWRRRPDGTVEVAIVHRPRYDDWSLPKGKLDPGEDSATAALREVAEETGHRGSIHADLGEVGYRKDGVDKVVRWYAMAAEETPPDGLAHEVDAVRWVPLDEAAAHLQYPTDRDVLDRFRSRLDTPG